MAKLLLVRRYLHNARSKSTSCKRGRSMSRCCEIRLRIHHASNWTCAHDHVLRALERICNDAGFATTHKRVLTSEGNRRADLEIRNIRVARRPICWWTSPCATISSALAK